MVNISCRSGETGSNQSYFFNLELFIMNHDEQSKKIGQVLAKCWSDESFKKKLMADPIGTLAAEGAKMPEGLSVNVLENTDKVFNLVIPAKPTDLADADLDKVAGGQSNFQRYSDLLLRESYRPN